jgi:hypothetical protein
MGIFRSVSAAWRLSQEDFMKNLAFVNDQRTRASYGQTGNQEGIGLYDYLQLINIGANGTYPFERSQTQSASLAEWFLNRTWETLINKNIGIDATTLSTGLVSHLTILLKQIKTSSYRSPIPVC